jgi:hypothetical protein
VDLEVQGRIKELAEQYGSEAMVVILGAPNVDSSLVQFETVTRGDPTYAGPLAGVQLGLKAYHVFEPEVKGSIDPAWYAELIEILELGLDSETIVRALQEARGK